MSLASLHELLQILAKTPETVSRLASNLPDEDLRHKNSPEEFSVLESICHLRDIEAEGYTLRIARILKEDRPLLPDIDGSRLAMERNYNRQDPDLALKAFADARKQNIQTLSSVGSEELDREGILEGAGTLTLAKLLLMLREHDESHVQELRAIREQLLRLRG